MKWESLMVTTRADFRTLGTGRAILWLKFFLAAIRAGIGLKHG